MKNLICFLLILPFISCQNKKTEQEDTLSFPAEIFNHKKAQVLVAGTFHFHYPGLDAHQTTDDDKVDVLSPKRQKEVIELANYIKKFKPTKIAIEATPKWKATQKFKQYIAGDIKVERDERYQLGFRIAKEMNLDTIYALDANSFADDLEAFNEEFVTKLFKDYDWKSDDPLEQPFVELYKYTDSLLKEVSLLNYFKLMNSKEYHQNDYGSYLMGDFKLDEYRGSDVLAAYWYSRNLRIFRKIQDISTPEDRVLVIFGNGHAAVLRQLIESSAEFDFIEFNSL